MMTQEHKLVKMSGGNDTPLDLVVEDGSKIAM